MRRFYWYLTAYIKKYGFLFGFTLLAGLGGFSVFLPQLLQNLENKPVSYIGIIGRFTLQTLPEEITQKISAGLTKIEPDGTVSPLLAERWTLEHSDTSYRFIIKQNLKWSDGEKLLAEDISYQFPDVETIVTSGDILFKLPAPYAPFPSLTTKPILKDGQFTKWFFLKKPSLIGVGPYQIIDYHYKDNEKHLAEIVLDKRDQRLVYRFYLTEKSAIEGFKKGEVDVLPDLGQIWPIMQWSNVKTTAKINTHQYSAIFFNHSNPKFTKNLRQALAYAIDKPIKEQRALGPISSDSWAYLEGVKSYDKDIDRSLERILEELPREKISFNLVTTTLFTKQAEEFKTQWEEMGMLAQNKCLGDKEIKTKELCENLKIEVQLRINNFPDTSDFDLLLVGQTSPSDPDQYEFWHSDQLGNFSKYKNTRIDTLLEKGRQTQSSSERLAIYQEFQQFITEDVAAIFLEKLPSYQVERK